MSDTVGGRKQPGFEPRQGTSREMGTSSSDMSVYKSSTEELVRKKESSVYKSSEEYFEYSCDPCKSVGDHVEARGFCTNCDEYLCSTCYRSHSRSKLSQHHILLDKGAMPRKTVKKCDPCKTAGDEIEAVGYCEDCTQYLCDGCYKSHSRSKLSRHHVLVDKTNMSEESERAVTSSIAKMNFHKENASNMRYNEEYTYIRDFSVKADVDEMDCHITDMTLISDNELVLCDNKNKSLKLVDIDNSIIKDVLGLQAKPLGITAISEDQVAVVLQNKYQILIISVSEGLYVVRTIKTNGNCLDVKFNDGKLYASFWRPVHFQILQPTGAIIKTIKQDSEVPKYCTLPRHIAVRPGESLIYVSDSKTNKVMSMDMDGNMVSLYQGELEKPYDITISSFGSVYICSRKQQVVYKMTSDLSEASVKLGPRDGLMYPAGICFNTDKQRLYISSGCDDAKYANFIKVYKLK